MSARKKPGNLIQRLYKSIRQLFNAITKTFINWILRHFLVLGRSSRTSRAGFVLPTVVMVTLVVVLLTTAVLFRSFDRSKNASNYRVNEAVLRAATPALDRARAKINYLFSPAETGLQGNTPSEESIASVLKGSSYTLGDEIPLKLQLKTLVADDPQDASKGNVPPLVSAWKFPIDTDNNGKFDSYTLYGIYFHTPPLNLNGNDKRQRTGVEARALPQNTGGTPNCGAGNSSAGQSEGWTSINGQLKKAFFTYVATVPITQQPTGQVNGINASEFETYKGNKGFTALEMQLDQARFALDNNAVWYEDDIEINEVPTFRINGRVHTNSNLLVSNSQYPIEFLQVSSANSCYYDPENAKINVAGNIATGDVFNSANNSNNNVTFDLYPGQQGQRPTDIVPIDDGNRVTTKNTPPEVTGNSAAFAQRLAVLRNGALNKYDPNLLTNNSNLLVTKARLQAVFPNPYEAEIIQEFEKKCPQQFNPNGCDSGVLRQVLDTYFRKRIRRVSYKEVPIDQPEKARQAGGQTLSSEVTPPAGETYVFAGKPGVVPPLEWMMIDQAYTQLTLNINGTKIELPTSEPRAGNKKETLIGDRIKVGNNLPQVWLKTATITPPDYATSSDKQNLAGITWDIGGGQRTRKPIAAALDDLGDTSRGGYWEKAAAKTTDLLSRDQDPAAQKLLGGLRVVTGAGIYIDGRAVASNGTGVRYDPATMTTPALTAPVRSFLPPPPITAVELQTRYPGARIQTTGLNAATVVWPDTMPMYQWKPFDPNDPSTTIWTDPNRNRRRDPGEGSRIKGDLQMRATVVYHYKDNETIPGEDQTPIACISSYYDPTDAWTADNANKISNNGLNYPVPSASRAPNPKLRRQANMIFPDGRWANPALRTAIRKVDQGATLTIADKAAFDAANCALSIIEGATPSGTGGKVPDGAIKEAAFLDARQVKALHKATVETDDQGNPILNGGIPIAIDPQTRREDLTRPERQKIAELASTINAASFTDIYTWPIEQRQPLEIRVTEINLDELRRTPIGSNTGGAGVNNDQEYLLPNSGVIYATRDDALPDNSDVNLVPQKSIDNGNSATDFKLDSTRRPNGIRLIKGENLERVQQYRTAEKGLILASDLPVYIKGDFNLHRSGGNPVEEFTDTLDLQNYGNFYTRIKPENPNFACRPGQKQGCNQGDQWRAARILSDAVTLLSKNFRDGYRNEGGYDFNNNAGNWVVNARLKNGFFWNNYATSADWYAPNGLPKNDFDTSTPEEEKSSYVTNAVTPIQRRVNFPEYLMEACTKLPVSECGPQDWVFAKNLLDGATTSASNPSLTRIPIDPRPNREGKNNAGTTAQPPQGIFQSAVRRVAFKRNDFGALVPPAGCSAAAAKQIAPNPALQNCVAQARGINPAPAPPNEIGDYYAGNTPTGLPKSTNNALWFWSTGDVDNKKPSVIDPRRNYDKTTHLYYPEDAETVSERQLLLPGTPEFPAILAIPSLNGTGIYDPSDFAVCTGNGASKDYEVSALTPGACPGRAKALQTWAKLRAQPVNKGPIPAFSSTPVTLTATEKVNIYALPPAGILGNLKLTLDKGTQSDPIFVFKAVGNTKVRFGTPNVVATNGPVELTLKGVDPNNIFWVSSTGTSGGFTINQTTVPHKLTGNFLGGPQPSMTINATSQVIQGGRILGFSSVSINPATITMTAMTTTAQPLLVPVLQLHSPKGQPGNPTATDSVFGGSNDVIENDWLPHAAQTTYNAALIMGDSPSRPAFPTAALSSNGPETGGGLGNFPRFLEAWEPKGDQNPDNATNARIVGSFIQFKRSAIATAPFQPIDNPARDTSLFFDGATPDYMNYFTNTDYRYRGGANAKFSAFYKAPKRLWGYDIGFLTQTADLFSKRFGTPSAGTPYEFYRTVGRDDPWVKTLLCAAQQTPRSNPPTYDNYALPQSQHPADGCPQAPYNQPET